MIINYYTVYQIKKYIKILTIFIKFQKNFIKVILIDLNILSKKTIFITTIKNWISQILYNINKIVERNILNKLMEIIKHSHNIVYKWIKMNNNKINIIIIYKNLIQNKLVIKINILLNQIKILFQNRINIYLNIIKLIILMKF